MSDLATSLARLGGALRAHGVPTSLRDELDAAAALPFVDRDDRTEVGAALRIALKIPRAAWSTFDRLLATVWFGDGGGRPQPAPPAPRTAPAPLPRGRLLAWDPEAGRMRTDADAPPAPPPPDGQRPAWSPAALLRRKSFDDPSWSPAELAAMERALDRLARRLAAHRGRRWVPAAHAARGRVDSRHSYRRALRTGGEVLTFPRRARAPDQPRLTFLCDTSGSMDTHARFLLTFVLALRRAMRRAEIFAFNTELTHLTPQLAPGRDAAAVLRRLGDVVPDWSGGTRIGHCLAAFADRHLARAVDGKTVVVILSDGLDRGDPEVLAGALRAIHARARRVVWINPLMGDPRYQPAARGMQAALPFIDRFVPAHDLPSLERLLPHLWG